jgi:hypothetical protein
MARDSEAQPRRPLAKRRSCADPGLGPSLSPGFLVKRFGYPSPLFFWHHGTEAYDGFAFRVGNGDQSQRCHSTVKNGSTATQIVIVVIAYLAAAA